jgi:hypothetical protein
MRVSQPTRPTEQQVQRHAYGGANATLVGPVKRKTLGGSNGYLEHGGTYRPMVGRRRLARC